MERKFAIDLRAVRGATGLRPGERAVLSTATKEDAVSLDVTVGDGEFTVFPGAIAKPVTLAILWDSPHFGGARAFIACPGCGRKVLVVYWASKEWRCRACHGLAYEVTRLQPVRRAARRVRQLYTRLGAPHAMPGTIPARPKGMGFERYWRTLRALLTANAEHMALFHERKAAKMKRYAKLRAAVLGEPSVG